jgi:hypothetical protein
MCALCSNLTLQQAGSNNIVYVGWEANMGARFMGKQPICIWRQGFLNACLLHGLIGCISSNKTLCQMTNIKLLILQLQAVGKHYG